MQNYGLWQIITRSQEVAAMVRPGYAYAGWTVFAVSYEVDQDMAITAVWTHEKMERPRSTRERHIRWNPTDTVK
jgi:aspartate aminotransferase-like enzyme